MQFKKIFCSFLLCLLIVFTTFAQDEQTINIALIADKASGLDKSPLVSLLEVELSQRENVRLLERAAIDKILDEHKLSAAGLLDRNNTIKIGKLLRADAFVILSTENTTPDSNMVSTNTAPGDLIRVRVSETAHGLRLLDCFEQSDTTSLENIVQKLESVLNKINQPDEKMIPVGIVDIHRVQLGEQYKMLERTLPTMLSVRLSLEPQIIVLEREDLKVLLDEKLMTEGEDTEFWSSPILIDGYLQPNNGQLELHLNLKQAGGVNLKSIIVPIEPNEPVAAIEQASTEIINELKNSPSTSKWNPKQEAEEFYNKAQMLDAHCRFEEAIPLFETAHVLQPQNIYYTGTLFEKLWIARRNIERKLNNPSFIQIYEPLFCPYSDLELTELVSVFVRQIRDGYDKGTFNVRKIYTNWSNSLGYSLSGPRGDTFFASSRSVSTEQIRQINRENRKIWVETFCNGFKYQILDFIKPLELANSDNIKCAKIVWISTDDPYELIENLKIAFTKFVMPPELGGEFSSDSDREELYKALNDSYSYDPNKLNRTHLKGSGEIVSKLWEEYLEEVKDVIEPFQNKGSNYKIDNKIYNSQNLQENLEYLRKEQQNQNPEKSKYISQFISRLLNDSISDFISGNLPPEQILVIWEELSGYLIDNNDISTLCSFLMSNPPTSIVKFIEDGTIYSKEAIMNFKRMRGNWSELTRNANTNTNSIIETQVQTDFYHRYVLFIEKISNALQSYDKNSQVKIVLNNMRNARAELEKQFSGMPVNIKQKLVVTNLLTPDDWLEHKYSYSTSLIIDEMLWVAMSSRVYSRSDKEGNWYYPMDIGLAGINLKNKSVTSLWEASIYPPNRLMKISGISITDKASYICLQNIGILQFPGSNFKGNEYFIDSNSIPKEILSDMRRPINLGDRQARRDLIPEKEILDKYKNNRTPKLYTMENGLPSLLITSIAQEENKFWLAYQDTDYESGLGIFDFNREQWETVFCSTINDGSPFNDGKPYQINSMLYWQPDTLFLNVSGGSQSGLWKMDTMTRKAGYIGSIEEELSDNTKVNFWLNVTSLKNYRKKGFLNDPFFTNAVKRSRISYLDLTSSAIHDNKLWAVYKPDQVMIIEKDKSFDESEIIDNSLLDGTPVIKFISTSYGLIAIGEGIVGLIEIENVEGK